MAAMAADLQRQADRLNYSHARRIFRQLDILPLVIDLAARVKLPRVE